MASFVSTSSPSPPRNGPPAYLPFSFFRPLRKASTVPSRPPVSRSLAEGIPISRPRRLAPQSNRRAPTGAMPASALPTSLIDAQTIAILRVADSIVGRHPNAIPVSARVPTQDEIDVVSGHVRIPWAHDTRRPEMGAGNPVASPSRSPPSRAAITRPSPVKVQSPPPVAAARPLAPSVHALLRNAEILDVVDPPNGAKEKNHTPSGGSGWRFPVKLRTKRSSREKENERPGATGTRTMMSILVGR